MTDWIRLSASKPNSIRNTRVSTYDAGSFEKRIKIARELQKNNNSMLDRSTHEPSTPATPNSIFYALHPAANHLPDAPTNDTRPQRAANAIRQKLQREVFDQLEQTHHSKHEIHSQTSAKHWSIDLSDLTEKNISINLTRHANGKWSAALSSSTVQKTDPILELLREQLTDLIYQKEQAEDRGF